MPLTWDQICEDPVLRNLPYKIETNRFGQIVMSPAKYWHSSRQGKIAGLMRELNIHSGSDVSTETAIQTTDGVKVADVAWASRAFFEAHRHESALSVAPEICVEILSDSNTREEMNQKDLLYFAQGGQRGLVVR